MENPGGKSYQNLKESKEVDLLNCQLTTVNEPSVGLLLLTGELSKSHNTCPTPAGEEVECGAQRVYQKHVGPDVSSLELRTQSMEGSLGGGGQRHWRLS